MEEFNVKKNINLTIYLIMECRSFSLTPQTLAFVWEP